MSEQIILTIGDTYIPNHAVNRACITNIFTKEARTMELFINRCNKINQIIKCIGLFVEIDPIITITMELICDYPETVYLTFHYIFTKIRTYIA